MARTNISVEHIARVEGHGNIFLSIEGGKVVSAQMRVVEPARLFESMVRGRRAEEVPYIASRVCGICSASHVVTDLEAIEGVFGIQVSDRTRALRELLVYGSYLQNHASHLFLFAAPDFLGMTSVFPLAEINPELFEQALALKALGNELCTKVGGRSIHPITAVIGGFTHEISADEYRSLAEKMRDMQGFVQQTLDLFRSFDVPAIKLSGDMIAMVEPGNYPVYGAHTARFVSAGHDFDANDYPKNFEEYPVSYSAALFSRVSQTKQPFFAGALSRINASWANLSKPAKVAAAKAGLRPPEYNPYMNNLAQCVELIDVIERCTALCERLAAADGGFEGCSCPVPYKPKRGAYTGFTEAPRGALFHSLTLDDEGRVKKASIVTPTAQNLASIEADMKTLATYLLKKGAESEDIKCEVEKLVRAYDPCYSCSVH